MKNAFAQSHPAINFVFFAFVILATIFVLHPVLLAVSFAASMAWSIWLNGTKAVRFNLLGLVPLMLVSMLINAAFNHAGVTILLYVNDNPITLESLLYGAAAAAMLASVIMWFSCYNRVMTSDKFIYLFGRVIPALSLVLSMALRFVPRYKRQIQKTAAAQRALGRDAGGGLIGRAKNGMRVLSIVTTWALENAIETADSMRCRGYGLKGRTAYANYRFGRQDKGLLAALLVLLGYCLGCMAAGVVSVQYFPSYKANPLTPAALLAFVAYAAVCLAPLILDAKEAATWRLLRLKG